MQKLYFLIVFAVASAFFWEGSQINFMANDLAAARHQAGKEGKLIVVQFGARWCLPCNIMYEGAWQNDEVVAFTNQNYVAVKMDIDQFDAMKLRDKLGLEAIPATVVLTSKGDEIKRFEGAMGSESLLGFLQTYAAPEHRSKINATPMREVETAEPMDDLELDKAAEMTAEATILNEKEAENSKLHPEEAPTEEHEGDKKGLLNVGPSRQKNENSSQTDLRTAAKPKQKVAEKPTAAPRAKPKTDAPIAFSAPQKEEKTPRKGLPKTPEKTFEKAPEKTQKRTARTGFTTQAGVFATPGQAEKLASEISIRFGKRAFLAEGIYNGKKVMRALIGDFSSREEAANFKMRLRNSGYKDAFVKSWNEVR